MSDPELRLKTDPKVHISDVWAFCDQEHHRIQLDREQFSGELCELRRQAQGETIDRLVEHLRELESEVLRDNNNL